MPFSYPILLRFLGLNALGALATTYIIFLKTIPSDKRGAGVTRPALIWGFLSAFLAGAVFGPCLSFFLSWPLHLSNDGWAVLLQVVLLILSCQLGWGAGARLVIRGFAEKASKNRV